MICDICHSKLEFKNINYVFEDKDKLFIVENVPAKVCSNCGEKLFSPEAVDQIQKTIWEKKTPVGYIETPIYKYAS